VLRRTEVYSGIHFRPACTEFVPRVFEGTKQDHAGEFPPEFDLTAFVYFPKSYAALDPSLDW